jgi:hypothetical protein
MGSQLRSDSKRLRSKYSRPTIFGYSANNLKRDPIIESIIESRKSVILENVYTYLAQTTSQIQHTRVNSLKSHSMIPKPVNQVHFDKINTKIINYQNEKKLLLPPILQFNNDQWDDGLNGDIDKGKISINNIKLIFSVNRKYCIKR